MKAKALTTLEILVVIAIFLTLLSAVTAQMIRLFFSNELEIGTQEMVHTLRRANSLSTNQVHDSAWGVQFHSTNDSYTLFSGTGYDSRVSARDSIFFLPDSIAYSSIALNGSATGVVFTQGSGGTSEYGDIALLDAEGNSVTIRVSSLGSVTVQ